MTTRRYSYLIVSRGCVRGIRTTIAEARRVAACHRDAIIHRTARFTSQHGEVIDHAAFTVAQLDAIDRWSTTHAGSPIR